LSTQWQSADVVDAVTELSTQRQSADVVDAEAVLSTGTVFMPS
jgi:hypothetical protein